MHALRSRLPSLLRSLILALAVSGCATQAPVAPLKTLLREDLFPAAPRGFDPQSLFALSPEMQRYAQERLGATTGPHDLRRKLIDALYAKGELRLAYDGVSTLTAREAFAARSGNCLSLVIMTAAFAKHLGLPVSYRSVVVDELYTRSADLTFASGHVNLVLAAITGHAWRNSAENSTLTVDFLPSEDTQGQRSEPLEERTLVAMYLNNRAAESLGQGHLVDAYAFARDALLQDEHFLAAGNTLAVVYQRAGHTPEAEAALRHVLSLDPDHKAALSNLAGLLTHTGRSDLAEPFAARLARLQPVPPFYQLELGRQAMAAGDYAAARDHFLRELRDQPYQDEVHFWAAQAYWKLGNLQKASYHLKQALDNSLTQRDQARYTAKLDHLRAHSAQ